MALITIATDNAEEAKRLIAALFGDPRQDSLPLAAEPAKPAARGKKADAEAPSAPAPSTAITITQAPPAAEVAPLPVPPVAVVPPPQPAPAPEPVPPAPVVEPTPAPQAALAPVAAQGEAAPGWTLDHVLTQATAFLKHDKGGPGKLKPLLDKHGIRLVKECPPPLFHVLYQDMAAILEA